MYKNNNRNSYYINEGDGDMNILRVKRKEMRLTLEEMSKKLNITLGALANYERDVRRPRFSEIWRIKEAYELTDQELLDWIKSYKSESEK